MLELMATQRIDPTPPITVGPQVEFIEAGTYQWTVPDDVTSVCVVAVGGGGSSSINFNGASYCSAGTGGALGYRNNLVVTPGEILDIVVGAGGPVVTVNGTTTQADGYAGGASIVRRAGTILLQIPGGPGGTAVYNTATAGGSIGSAVGADGGGSGGGCSRLFAAGIGCGGGGAGGYSGTGGSGAATNVAIPGQGGAGGGGNAALRGGGVGIRGEGPSGPINTGTGGVTGNGSVSNGGGAYGSGGSRSNNTSTHPGGGGAVRIIWGPGRAYPSTLTEDIAS